MKLFCNGFNLFRQLNVSKPVLEEFTPSFEFEVMNQVWINQSYSIIATNEDYLLCQKEGVSNLNSLLNNKIALLTANDDQVIFSDNQGKLLKCSVDDFNSIEEVFEKSDTNVDLINISCGSKLIIAYFCDGSIYKVPQKLSFARNDITDIKCGKEHCLLLDKSGNLYSFGAGSRGQLGHGKLDDEPEPKLVEALAGIKIRKIATGGWHSCAISEEGDLYVWGWNSKGQLGLGKSPEENGFFSVMASPTLIDFDDENSNAVCAASGSRHLIILLDTNQLYGCGWNKYHQLTKHDQENYFEMTHLHDFEGEKVVNLHCGPWNSAVLVV